MRASAPSRKRGARSIDLTLLPFHASSHKFHATAPGPGCRYRTNSAAKPTSVAWLLSWHSSSQLPAWRAPPLSPKRSQAKLRGIHGSDRQLGQPPAHERSRTRPSRARCWITPEAATAASWPLCFKTGSAAVLNVRVGLQAGVLPPCEHPTVRAIAVRPRPTRRCGHGRAARSQRPARQRRRLDAGWRLLVGRKHDSSGRT
jgi:hypothetical protein